MSKGSWPETLSNQPLLIKARPLAPITPKKVFAFTFVLSFPHSFANTFFSCIFAFVCHQTCSLARRISVALTQFCVTIHGVSWICQATGRCCLTSKLCAKCWGCLAIGQCFVFPATCTNWRQSLASQIDVFSLTP